MDFSHGFSQNFIVYTWMGVKRICRFAEDSCMSFCLIEQTVYEAGRAIMITTPRETWGPEWLAKHSKVPWLLLEKLEPESKPLNMWPHRAVLTLSGCSRPLCASVWKHSTCSTGGHGELESCSITKHALKVNHIRESTNFLDPWEACWVRPRALHIIDCYCWFFFLTKRQ